MRRAAQLQGAARDRAYSDLELALGAMPRPSCRWPSQRGDARLGARPRNCMLLRPGLVLTTVCLKRNLGRLHRHPDEPVGDNDSGRPVPDLDRLHDLPRRRVDARDRPVAGVGDPHEPAPTATAIGSSPTGICTVGVRARVDPRHDVVTAARDPHRHRDRRRCRSTGCRRSCPAEGPGPEGWRIEAVDGRVAGAHDPDRAAALDDRGRPERRRTSARSCSDFGSMRASVASPKTAHTHSDPVATAPSGEPDPRRGDVERLHAAELGIDPRDLPGQAVRRPRGGRDRTPRRVGVASSGMVSTTFLEVGIDARHGLAVEVGRVDRRRRPRRAARAECRPGPGQRRRSTSDR